MTLYSILVIVWLIFEIFQKFFFPLLAKTFVHLQNKKLVGYSKHCTLEDSPSDLHFFWITL